MGKMVDFRLNLPVMRAILRPSASGACYKNQRQIRTSDPDLKSTKRIRKTQLICAVSKGSGAKSGCALTKRATSLPAGADPRPGTQGLSVSPVAPGGMLLYLPVTFAGHWCGPSPRGTCRKADLARSSQVTPAVGSGAAPLSTGSSLSQREGG